MSFVRINGILDKFDEFVLLTHSACKSANNFFVCAITSAVPKSISDTSIHQNVHYPTAPIKLIFHLFEHSIRS